MLLGSRGGTIRCLVVWTVVTAALTATSLVAWSSMLAEATAWPGRLRGTPLDVALTEVAALALLGCALWMWAATTAVVVEVVRRRPGRAPRGVPAGVRRVVLAACGVALTGALTHPSYAAGPQAHHVHVGARAHPSPLSGLPLPDRAVAGPPSVTRTVVVRPGDTLWSLAARDLPDGSPDAVVAHRWHAFYAANRSLIGPDPDVIVPGQRLHLPGKEPS